MNRDEFIRKASERGLSRDQIKEAIVRHRQEIGAFDDDAPEAEVEPIETEATPEPVGVAEALFPRTLSGEKKSPLKQAGPMALAALPGGALLTEAGQDLMTLGTRAGGAIASKAGVESATGGKEGFLEGMADTETGLLRKAREQMGAILSNRLGNLKDRDRSYWKKVGDVLVAEVAAAGHLTASVLEDPFFLAGLASQVVKKSIKGASGLAKSIKGNVADKTKLPAEALERAAKDPQAVTAAAGTQEQLTYSLSDEVTKIRQGNKVALESERAADAFRYDQDVADLLADYEARVASQEKGFEAATRAQKEGLEAGVLKERPGAPMAKATEISPYESGKRFETAAASARKAIGQKYGQRLDESFKKSGIADLNLPRKTLTGEKAKALTGSPKAVSMNPMQEFIDDALTRSGYDRAKGYQQLEGISKGAVDWLLKKREGAGNIRTLEQALKFRKNFQDDLFASSTGPNALFPRSGQAGNDFRFLKSVYDESNNLIAEIPAKTLGKKEGETWKKLWTELRRDYAEPESAIEELAEGLGKSASPEDFMSRFKNVATDDIVQMKRAAANHKEVQPLVSEMEQMAFDNMVRVSLDAKNGNAFSPEKFIQLFNTEDKARLKALLGPERVARIQGAVSKYKLPEKPTPLPKPTLPEKPNLKLLSNEPAFPNLAGASQEVNQGKIRSNIANMGQDPKVFAMRELEFLDNALGLKGKERYSEKVLDAWAANKLGVDPNLKQFPKENPLRTGYATAGKVTGAATGGAIAGGLGHAVMGPAGAYILAPIGMTVGQHIGGRIVSPSTAVAVYRAMNKLEGVKASPKAVALMKAIRDAGNASAVAKLSAELEKEIQAQSKAQKAPKAREEALATP